MRITSKSPSVNPQQHFAGGLIKFSPRLCLAVVLSAWLTGVAIQAPAFSASAVSDGVRYYNQGYIQKAIPLFEKAYKANPQDEQANLWLARSYKKQGGTELLNKAKMHYEAVLQSNPNNIEALTDLGEILSWNPNTRPQAMIYLQQAWELDSSNVDTARVLSTIYGWERRYNEALKYADAIAPVMQNNTAWLKDYAHLLGQTRDRADEAVSLYEGPLQNELSKSDTLRGDYAIALKKAGRNDEALARYNTLRSEVMSLSNNGSDMERRLLLAKTAYELGQYEDAIAIDQSMPATVITERPEIPMRLARSYGKTGRYNEAFALLNKVYQSGKMTSDMKIEYADALSEAFADPTTRSSLSVSPSTAEEIYQSVLRERPKDPKVYMSLARFYGQDETQFEKAVNHYHQAMALDSTGQAKTEFMDYLKSASNFQTAPVNDVFRALTESYPQDPELWNAYAEYLSWKDTTRQQAMEIYYNLVTSVDPAHQDTYIHQLEQVLEWHVPSVAYMPTYQKLQTLMPNNKNLQLGMARAYANSPEHHQDAVSSYQKLTELYPGDETIKGEWAALNSGNAENRGESLKTLAAMIEKSPEDTSLRTQYGRLLSYDRQYGKSVKQFNWVLDKDPKNREALIGKGHALLWANKLHAAKDVLTDAREIYPGDVEVLMALAKANKGIGRYDKAYDLLDEIQSHLSGQMPDSTSEAMSSSDQVNASTSKTSTKKAVVWSEQKITPQMPNPGQFVYPNANPAALPGAYVSLPDEKKAGTKAQPAAENVENSIDAPINLETSPNTAPEVIRLEQLLKGADITPDADVPAYYAMMQTGELTPASYEYKVPSTTQPSTGKTGPVPAITPTVVQDNGQISDTDMDAIQKELNAIDAQLKALENLQQESAKTLSTVERRIDTVHDLGTTGTVYAAEEQPAHNFMMQADSVNDPAMVAPEDSLLSGTQPFGNILSQYSGTGLDGKFVSGAASGSRLYYEEALTMEEDLDDLFRPEFRTGYTFSTQEGENTTTALRYWGIPNQLSLSLTPQLRVRGSFDPYRYYIPRSPIEPDSSFAYRYNMGATYRPLDRLTLDGDLGIFHFSQPDDVDILYNARARIDVTDWMKFKVGGRRNFMPNSLLAVTGLKPSQGAFAGNTVGQARENVVYTELNLIPYRNWDVNVGYEWGLINGERIPDNTKNQVFASLGHTWDIGRTHHLRLGYQFLWFGYSKYAFGFFDTTNSALTVPVVTMKPTGIAAPAGTRFGGYFSPDWFVQNAARLDLRGSLFNKHLEYKLGGSLGVQAFDYAVNAASPTSMSSAFDIYLQHNILDWLSTYGFVDYLDGGGQFNRWQFGGGLIIRPDIKALSPVFGR